jgi:hypothetical protein
MSVALWMATTPLPLARNPSTAWRWAAEVHTMPEVWNMTSTSKVARLAGVKTFESSVCTTSKLLAAACSENIATPAGIESWR